MKNVFTLKPHIYMYVLNKMSIQEVLRSISASKSNKSGNYEVDY